MPRILVPRDDDETPGWFDPDKAREKIRESTWWDGNSRRGQCSGLQIGGAVLYRTAGGRWVLHTDGRFEHNGSSEYEWLTDEQAREWLIKSSGGNDRTLRGQVGPAKEAREALERYWPPLDAESGPSKGGRPAIDGEQINVKFPHDLLRRIDADRGSTSRAKWLRDMAEAALDR